MPAPWSMNEVKQFLGLAGYHHKFVPQFSDLSRPLTRLTLEGCTIQMDQGMSIMLQTVEGDTLHTLHTMLS